MGIMSFIAEYICSPLLTSVMTSCALFFFFYLKIYSLKRIKRDFGLLKSGGGSGGISPAASLSVALAGTLGVGNIAGVAVAVSVGGAGAVFWMTVSALLGAVLKYCEAYLSVKTRNTGTGSGGAPVYAERISGRRTGAVYAVLCVVMSFFSGSFIQMNAAASSLRITYGVPRIVSGCVFAALCLVIALGGIKRVSAFTSAAMPVFCAVFAALSLIAVSMKLNEVPSVAVRIMKEAFGIRPVSGGFCGAVLAAGLRQGMTKGVFSHEAGCGTSSFSHAASSTESPGAQGIIGVLEVVTDTIVFGSLTALVMLTAPDTGQSYDGASLAISAYSYFFGAAASHILTVLTVFFAFATVLCWAYYGCEAISYLDRGKGLSKTYLILYCSSLVAGALFSAAFIWQATDILSSLMLTLNCAVLLRGRKLIK